MESKYVWMTPPSKPRQRFLVERKFAFMLKAKGWKLISVRKFFTHA